LSNKTQPEQSMAGRVAGNAAWAMAGRGIKQVLGIGISFMLLRHLLPGDYGLADMALVFVYIAGEVRDLRLADALIQRKELDNGHLSSAFCIHAGAGLLLSVILVSGAPFLSDLYNEPQILPVAVALGIRPFIDSLSDVSRVLLERKMLFKKTAIADLVSLIIAGALTIFLAVKGYGVWALVAMNLGSSIVTSTLLVIWGGWIPTPIIIRARVKELWNFSIYLYGARFLAQIGKNIDKLLVGKYLGVVSVGLYTRGFSIMTMPLERIVWVVGRVMCVALSDLQDDLERFRSAYLRAVRMVSFVVFPITVGLCVTIGEVLAVIARPEWLAATRVIRIFCIVGLLESVMTSVGWIYFSLGRTRRQFAWTFVPVIVTIIAVSIGLRYQIEGVAWAYLIRTAIMICPNLLVGFRLAGLKLAALFRSLLATTLAVTIMAVVVLCVRFWLMTSFSIPTWQTLVAQVFTGIVVYCGLLWGFGAEVWTEAISVISGFVQGENKEVLK